MLGFDLPIWVALVMLGASAVSKVVQAFRQHDTDVWGLIDQLGWQAFQTVEALAPGQQWLGTQKAEEAYVRVRDLLRARGIDTKQAHLDYLKRRFETWAATKKLPDGPGR